MNHVIYLTYLYHRNKTTNKIPLYNGGLNSLSKYLLNNFIEIVSKCTLLEVPDIVPKFKKESLFQIRYKTKFYKIILFHKDLITFFLPLGINIISCIHIFMNSNL